MPAWIAQLVHVNAARMQHCSSVRWVAQVEAGGVTIAPDRYPFPPGDTRAHPRNAPRRFTVASAGR